MLKQLMLTRKIDAFKADLAEAENVFASLVERRSAIDKRGEEIESGMLEVTSETSEEDKSGIEEMAAQWSEEEKALTEEEAANEQKRVDLKAQIDALTAELEKFNARAEKPVLTPETKPTNERKDDFKMNRKFFGMSREERSAFFADEKAKSFLSQVRSAITEKRAITNVGLTIPQVMLPLIEQVVADNSQLLPYVNVENLSGTGRQRIMGDIPEAIWTEMCAKLNEVALTFNMVEFDGFKVGAFIPVCNAVLEDNDVELADKIVSAIGKGIALAVDKAIIFGTGTKMPVGIFTRLAQTAAPDDADPVERAWVDLHAKNIKTIASIKTGADLYKEILKASAVTNNKYAHGNRFWAMNQTTFTNLQAEMLTINASGAIVTGQNMVMPIIGGNVVILDFMPDNMIVGGYGANYTVVRRRGVQFAVSDEYKFVEDQTVFKGTARYDGKPVIAESFVAIGLGSAPSAATVTFAPDAANA